ncbi:hypothetical protein, partial [uncultured Microscilla sp.]|uniref:hypothetical protein n=1 Tax=uncultured Microscilla sp. TaxID=432653 RepID=UPI002613A109
MAHFESKTILLRKQVRRLVLINTFKSPKKDLKELSRLSLATPAVLSVPKGHLKLHIKRSLQTSSRM